MRKYKNKISSYTTTIIIVIIINILYKHCRDTQEVHKSSDL